MKIARRRRNFLIFEMLKYIIVKEIQHFVSPNSQKFQPAAGFFPTIRWEKTLDFPTRVSNMVGKNPCFFPPGSRIMVGKKLQNFRFPTIMVGKKYPWVRPVILCFVFWRPPYLPRSPTYVTERVNANRKALWLVYGCQDRSFVFSSSAPPSEGKFMLGQQIRFLEYRMRFWNRNFGFGIKFQNFGMFFPNFGMIIFQAYSKVRNRKSQEWRVPALGGGG